ncbi:MAG: hypothetical protein ACK41D_06350 [Rubricoccaceae bacterium]
MRPLLRSLPAAALAAALFVAAGCDSYVQRSEVRVVDFSLDGRAYTVSTDGRVATFESDDITNTARRSAVRSALATAGDGALVLLYADNSLVLDVTPGQSWMALPVTRGFEAVDAAGVPYVDYFVTYTYAFDNDDLYFDVVSTAQLSTIPAAELDLVIPRRIDLRLVTIPAGSILKHHVDLKNYEAVRAAYGLPD